MLCPTKHGGPEAARVISQQQIWQDALLPQTPLADGGGEPGAYIIDSWISAGGHGAVCTVRVTDRPGMYVAKFLLEDRNVPRFFHEAAWQASGLPGVVPVLWTDQTTIPRLGRTVPMMIMPYYHRGNLYGMRHVRGYSTQQAVRWILDVACALRNLPLVHRDIKPENILLNENFEAELADFGIAIPKDPKLREVYGLNQYEFIGTGPYMAPEQCLEGDMLDERTDIYALGLVLYEMLTYETAYAEEFAIQDVALMKLVNPCTFEKVADPALRSIIARCSCNKMSARYQSAADLCEALTGWLHANPERPHP